MRRWTGDPSADNETNHIAMRNSPPTSTGANAVNPTSTTTVLIVDDHSGYRAVASAVVDAAPGFSVVGTATDTTEALTVLDQLPAPPDLILMDVNLGRQSGIEATGMILTRHPDVKVVLISTLASDDLPPEATTCGADGYLPKMKLTTAALEDVWAGAYDWKS